MKKSTLVIGYICIAFCVVMATTGYYVNALPQQLAEENAIGQRIEYNCPNDVQIIKILNLTNSRWELHAYNITDYVPLTNTAIVDNQIIEMDNCNVSSVYNIYSWKDKLVMVNATDFNSTRIRMNQLEELNYNASDTNTTSTQ